MSIEFDHKKAASNLKKHSVSFDEAASALLDPMALVIHSVISRSERMKGKAHGAQEPECINTYMRTPSTAQRNPSSAQ